MSKKRKIAVVSGTRAEYGLLAPVMQEIQKSPHLELNLIATGMHLIDKHGYTIQEITKDAFPIKKIVPMYLHGTDDSIFSKSFGIGVIGFSQAFEELHPSLLLVLGDRLEILAAVIVAATMNIPIAHIHGGERSESGHIDESIRHAISRFAHIHFTSTKESSKRLQLFGEEPWRINCVGAPGLDVILNIPLKDKDSICRQLRLDPKKAIMICVQHSVLLEKERAYSQMQETMKALRRLGMQTVVVYPNSDPGGDKIIEVIEQHRRYSNIHIFQNLDRLTFLSLMKAADVMIGNSSASIIESPAFHLPVVHIGTRNKGREHAENVLFVGHKAESIIKGVNIALYDKEFHQRVKKCHNPYGDGNAGKRIVKIIETIPLDDKLLRKQIVF